MIELPTPVRPCPGLRRSTVISKLGVRGQEPAVGAARQRKPYVRPLVPALGFQADLSGSAWPHPLIRPRFRYPRGDARGAYSISTIVEGLGLRLCRSWVVGKRHPLQDVLGDDSLFGAGSTVLGQAQLRIGAFGDRPAGGQCSSARYAMFQTGTFRRQ